MRFAIRAALTIALACGTSGLGRANPTDAYAAGSEGRAMAGAQTALETSGAAAYANPANLAMATATRLDLSLSDFGTSLQYNGGNGGSDAFAGLEVSMVLPLPGILKHAAVGLYGLVPADDLGQIVVRDASSPQFLQASQLHRFTLFGAVAYKLGPVAVGGGVQVLNSANGLVSFSTDVAAASVGPRILAFNLVPTLAPVLGASVDATPELRIGASYRAPGGIEIELPSDVTLGPIGIDLQMEALTDYRPPTWNAGVGFHSSLLAADLDVSYLQWSQAPDESLRAAVTTVGAPLPTLTTSPSGITLRDTPIVRLGAELYLPAGFALMAGYAYVPTPVPTLVNDENLFDNDRHELGAGVSYSFIDPLGLSNGRTTLSLSGQYQAMVTRQVEKTDPLDLYGDARYGGSLFAITAAVAMRFGATP